MNQYPCPLFCSTTLVAGRCGGLLTVNIHRTCVLFCQGVGAIRAFVPSTDLLLQAGVYALSILEDQRLLISVPRLESHIHKVVVVLVDRLASLEVPTILKSQLRLFLLVLIGEVTYKHLPQLLPVRDLGTCEALRQHPLRKLGSLSCFHVQEDPRNPGLVVGE